jgi:hypothetical protein
MRCSMISSTSVVSGAGSALQAEAGGRGRCQLPPAPQLVHSVAA